MAVAARIGPHPVGPGRQRGHGLRPVERRFQHLGLCAVGGDGAVIEIDRHHDVMLEGQRPGLIQHRLDQPEAVGRDDDGGRGQRDRQEQRRRDRLAARQGQADLLLGGLLGPRRRSGCGQAGQGDQPAQGPPPRQSARTGGSHRRWWCRHGLDDTRVDQVQIETIWSVERARLPDGRAGGCTATQRKRPPAGGLAQPIGPRP